MEFHTTGLNAQHCKSSHSDAAVPTKLLREWTAYLLCTFEQTICYQRWASLFMKNGYVTNCLKHET